MILSMLWDEGFLHILASRMDDNIAAVPCEFDPEEGVTIANLKHLLSNTLAAKELKKARSLGRFYLPQTPADVIHFGDFDHLIHNAVSRILWVPKNHEEKEGDLLRRSVLQQAVDKLQDHVLSCAMDCAYDKLGHAVSQYFISHRGLQAQLEELGFIGDALLLEVLGESWQAWKRPHLTLRVRTEALEWLSVVVWRILGVSNVLDGRFRAERTAGIVTDQLFDLLSDVDARLEALTRLADCGGDAEGSFRESSTTTRSLESLFSLLAGQRGVGDKPYALGIQQRLRHIEVAQLVKYSCTDNFSCRFSKKRRYQSDADHEDYSDGSSSLKDDAKWILDMSKVAARFCRNHASVHHENARTGGVGC